MGNGDYLIKLCEACIEHLLCTDIFWLPGGQKEIPKESPRQLTHHVAPGCLLSTVVIWGSGKPFSKGEGAWLGRARGAEWRIL